MVALFILVIASGCEVYSSLLKPTSSSISSMVGGRSIPGVRGGG